MSDLNDTIDRLLDNWELHNKLAEQTRQADMERERLVRTAFEQGADYSRLTISTGLTRTTLWRMRKRFDSLADDSDDGDVAVEWWDDPHLNI